MTFDLKGRVALPNQMNFRESAKKGRGIIFNPKIYVADFGNFKQGFMSMKLIQNSNYRVQGIFFNNCTEKNKKRHTLKKALVVIPVYGTGQARSIKMF